MGLDTGPRLGQSTPEPSGPIYSFSLDPQDPRYMLSNIISQRNTILHKKGIMEAVISSKHDNIYSSKQKATIKEGLKWFCCISTAGRNWATIYLRAWYFLFEFFSGGLVVYRVWLSSPHVSLLMEANQNKRAPVEKLSEQSLSAMHTRYSTESKFLWRLYRNLCTIPCLSHRIVL